HQLGQLCPPLLQGPSSHPPVAGRHHPRRRCHRARGHQPEPHQLLHPHGTTPGHLVTQVRRRHRFVEHRCLPRTQRRRPPPARTRRLPADGRTRRSPSTTGAG